MGSFKCNRRKFCKSQIKLSVHNILVPQVPMYFCDNIHVVLVPYSVVWKSYTMGFNFGWLKICMTSAFIFIFQPIWLVSKKVNFSHGCFHLYIHYRQTHVHSSGLFILLFCKSPNTVKLCWRVHIIFIPLFVCLLPLSMKFYYRRWLFQRACYIMHGGDTASLNKESLFFCYFLGWPQFLSISLSFSSLSTGDMGVGKSCLLHQFTEKKCKCCPDFDSFSSVCASVYVRLLSSTGVSKSL